MEFVWDDGGRSSCGFVGLAGDCVTRSIAIATGMVYRDVYDRLAEASKKSPRNGVRVDIAAAFLQENNWKQIRLLGEKFNLDLLPRGNVVLHLIHRNGRSAHFCAMIDHVLHDTWNPSDDDDYVVQSYWTHPDFGPDSDKGARKRSQSSARPEDLTQEQFDKILNRLRALDRTAQNGASTDAEKHNAIRMMQSLMLRHNLSREDISAKDNIDAVQFTRIACAVNGSRSCNWEKALANFVTSQVLPSTQWFASKNGHRTLFWFYGPLFDVRNAISLFQELLVTIAAAAKLQFGGYTRGSGASYAEGYVRGLPRPGRVDVVPPATVSTLDSANITGDADVLAENAAPSQGAENAILQTKGAESLIQLRTIALQKAAMQWLFLECDIKLVAMTGSGRYSHDGAAEQRGLLHGSKHDISVPNAPKRLH